MFRVGKVTGVCMCVWCGVSRVCCERDLEGGTIKERPTRSPSLTKLILAPCVAEQRAAADRHFQTPWTPPAVAVARANPDGGGIRAAPGTAEAATQRRRDGFARAARGESNESWPRRETNGRTPATEESSRFRRLVYFTVPYIICSRRIAKGI